MKYWGYRHLALVHFLTSIKGTLLLVGLTRDGKPPVVRTRERVGPMVADPCQRKTERVKGPPTQTQRATEKARRQWRRRTGPLTDAIAQYASYARNNAGSEASR